MTLPYRCVTLALLDLQQQLAAAASLQPLGEVAPVVQPLYVYVLLYVLCGAVLCCQRLQIKMQLAALPSATTLSYGRAKTDVI